MTHDIETATGRFINPIDPDPSQIVIEDVAHALAHVCRFGGHSSSFYSVAQHAVLTSHIVPAEDAFSALMHDASEAYLGDIPRPLKYNPAFLSFYRGAEERLMSVIADVFGFAWPLPESVKEADEIMARTEARDLMHGDWWRDGEVVDALIDPWHPVVAKNFFLWRFRELTE